MSESSGGDGMESAWSRLSHDDEGGLLVPVPMVNDESNDTPQDGTALCLSGGGYRAMLFHLGSLWRLNDAGMLPRLNRISSVSGGSITSAVLGLHWKNLALNAAGVAQDFLKVVAAVRGLAGVTIDVRSGIWGLLTPGRSISEYVVKEYEQRLFGTATLQDLPTEVPAKTPAGEAFRSRCTPQFGPRFVFNATNLQSGALWRFSKPYMADYLVGMVKNPTIRLSQAVAASSAFPPFLSPFHLRVDPSTYDQPAPGKEPRLHRPPFTTDIILCDGGVYDNLGLETAWKRYTTILVSNAGGKLSDDPTPPIDWARQSKRVLDVIDNQVRSLRARQVVDSLKNKERRGAYWSIRTAITDFHAPNCLNCPPDKTLALAQTATRLAALSTEQQERLINWGYAITDAALRSFVDTSIQQATGFPYPNTAV